MGLFTSFNVGAQGIRSAQSGLNTTSHNLANTKTKGYTRQQNINTDLFYQTYKTTERDKLKIGLGTRVAAIRQIRDMFLDKEYRVEASRQTFYEQQFETATEIYDVFGEMDGMEFRNAMEDLWEEIQSLSTDPQSVVHRELFISGAEAFLQKAQEVYDALVNYQVGLNDEIQKQVDRINEIADGIAAYNTLISYSEASGLENANDYRDARNLLLDELAEITHYTYEEDVDGRVQVYINSQPLVVEGLSFHMHCEQISDDSPMLKPVWSDNGGGDVYVLDEAYSMDKKTDTGSLLGMLTARGSKYATFKDLCYEDLLNPPVMPQEDDYRKADGSLDQTKYDAAMADYELAMSKFNNWVKDFNNTTGNSIIEKTEAQFDKLIHDLVTMINDVFCPNVYCGRAMGEFAGKRLLDVAHCPVGTDDEQTFGEELFTRGGTERYTKVTVNQQIYLTDDNGNRIKDENGNDIPLAKENEDGSFTVYVYNEEQADDFGSQYTLRNLEVNADILANYSLLPIKSNPYFEDDGGYDQDIFTELLENWQNKGAVLNPNDLTVYSYNEYFNALVGEIAVQGQVWESMADNQEALTESIEDKRQQVAGVSSDEELVYLLQYQHAFNAAARYINVIDEMLEHLIERLG